MSILNRLVVVFSQLTVLLARMEETVHREPASVRAVISVIRASGVSKVWDLKTSIFAYGANALTERL